VCLSPRPSSCRASISARRIAAHRGAGAADALLAQCEECAGELGYRALWLCVWERNPRAVAFYRRRGFAQAGAMDIPVEGVAFHDIVMFKAW
jgi:RimJ/RimL family protein N-acetyltransferase